MAGTVFAIGMFGASDINDRNNRNWPNLLTRVLQIGKTSRVRADTFGFEGQGSTQWLADNRHLYLADTMPDVALLSFFADGAPGFGISTSQSLTNIYTTIDALRAKRNMPIYLLKMWRMPTAQETISFPNLAAMYGNYPTVVANRSNVGIIDCYTAWGDPALHPEEFDVGDQVHPLLNGHLRVTIPTISAAIAGLIS